MPTRDNLYDIGIQPWSDISSRFFKSPLLLGNGFSINIHNRFRYESLYDSFLNSCDEQEKIIFNSFETTNFESIMGSLKEAERINELFNLETESISNAGNKLREGLIAAVQNNHPKVQDINNDILRHMSEQLDQFGDVFSLSYDALMYRIILINNDRHGDNPEILKFNDIFWGRYNDRYLKFMGYQEYEDYKHIYYLHGALFIFRKGPDTLKLLRTYSEELLSCIEQEIEQGYMPLFVAEGRPHDKYEVITRSEYLLYANRMLRDVKDKLVIYGASLSENDKHIVASIKKYEPELAISIFIGDKDKDSLENDLRYYRQLFPRQEVTFFDSDTLFTLS